MPLAIPHGLTLAHPEALYLLAIPALVLLWGIINAREFRRVFAPLMRAAALALFVIALANPQRVMHSEGAARPVLVDASASISPAMRAWTVRLLREELALRGGDPAFMFARPAVPEPLSTLESAFESAAGCSDCVPTATNLETALYRIAADPDAHGGPAVLVTDGWQNRGDPERAISAIGPAEIPLHLFTPPAPPPIPHLAITHPTLPHALAHAPPFPL